MLLCFLFGGFWAFGARGKVKECFQRRFWRTAFWLNSESVFPFLNRPIYSLFLRSGYTSFHWTRLHGSHRTVYKCLLGCSLISEHSCCWLHSWVHRTEQTVYKDRTEQQNNILSIRSIFRSFGCFRSYSMIWLAIWSQWICSSWIWAAMKLGTLIMNRYNRIWGPILFDGPGSCSG